MTTVNGFFDPAIAASAPGYARSTVFTYAPTRVPRDLWQLDVCFEIDTGSKHTILLDLDFFALTTLLCPFPLGAPAEALQWVLTRPDVFRPAGQFWTVGGDTPPMFRIQYAWLRLADPDDPAAKGENQLSPLYGGFSEPFLAPPAPSFPSLLGRETLARTSGMLWRRYTGTPRLIEIRGV